MSDEQQNDGLFQGLILSLAAAVMQHMGKTLNPMTQKIEKNMQAAQSTIDMLDMLEAKTKGNLSETEAKLMTHVLSELKMNYVETLNEKTVEPTEAAKSVEEPKAEESASSEKPEAAAESKADAAPESTEAPADKSEKKPDSAD